ncbi:MBL fold metallo-hydrolase [Neobacillus dielmonensis]|uniref:MBL fold metallo-hydrolase n=1 Tax=Neobacillus dielmonensis TaxID=1347369 RepID=UPI0005A8A844|nr:MBL fold metallo-hydrolase [Neobacillus dielmonensis]
MIQFQNQYITVFQSGLYQTTCTVVEAKEFVLVVDPNWLPAEVEEIKQHVARIQGKKPLLLLFTHGDFDHIIGYRAFPSAKVIGSKGLAGHPDKRKTLEQIHEFDNDYYIERPYPIDFPEVEFVVDEDGKKLVLGETTMTFYLAPGHTHDGIFTVIEPLGVWVAGDYLSDFELPFISHSVKEYQNTLRKASTILDSHNIKVMVPGHGQTASSQEEVLKRIQLAENYLDQLIAAVQNENLGIMDELEKQMAYPSKFTKLSHQENISIIRREYKGDRPPAR